MERILMSNGNFSTEMGMLTWAYRGKYVAHTKKQSSVYTIFSQPIKSKLDPQTFIQYTRCRYNILRLYTVLIHCLHSDSDCILS